MRVLVAVNDAFGHVLPLVPTVHEFARRGHEVLVACPGGTAEVAGIDGVRISAYEANTPPLAIPAPPREQRAARLAWSVHTSWPNAARGWAAALLADARQFRPDLVVCEPVEHAGRVVAAALGVPLVEHGWGFTLPAGGDATASAGLADLYRSVGATPRQPVLRVDLGSASVQSTDAEPAVYRYRYLPWGIPAEALPPPGSTPRVLLTLGTFPHPDAADRLRTAACAAAEVGAELVVVLGHDDRGDDRGWPAGTTVVRRVDLPSEITRCSLVVHHGGAGTAWATLAAGVPAVCLPQAGDQFRNAGLLAEVGAAAVVPPDAADLPTLRRTFTQALTDPALNAGAKRVQRENESLPPVSALVERIEALGPSPAQPAEHVRA